MYVVIDLLIYLVIMIVFYPLARFFMGVDSEWVFLFTPFILLVMIVIGIPLYILIKLSDLVELFVEEKLKK